MPDEPTSRFPDFAGALALLFVAGLVDIAMAGGVRLGLHGLGIDGPIALSMGLTNVLTFGLAAWVAYRLTDQPLRAVFALRPVSLRIVPGIAALLVGLTVLAAEGLALLTQIMPIPPNLYTLFEDVTVGSGLVGLFVVAGVGPIAEELLFRGVILGGLLSHYRPRWAIMGSAVLFGAMHLNPWQFVPAFAMGLIGGWLVMRTRSLWPSVALHVGYNALAGFALAPLLSRIGLGELMLATSGVLPLLPGWLLAAGIGLTALGMLLIHRTLPALGSTQPGAPRRARRF
jgi:membrane protease YdiL (CAAX protease family)